MCTIRVGTGQDGTGRDATAGQQGADRSSATGRGINRGTPHQLGLWLVVALQAW